MSLTDDPSKVDVTPDATGQQTSYLILSEAERAKGFVRPVRCTYTHVGIAGPKYPTRPLTESEQLYNQDSPPEEHFVVFEVYPEGTRATGRFWTQKELDSVGKGCGSTTTMARELGETYARNPHFYSATFCVGCRVHLPVGPEGEFVWEDGSRVGT